MGWVEMSERELRRAEVLASVFAGRLTMTAAAGLMGVSRRQAHRLARQFADQGAAGLRHRARGRPSNRRLGPHVRELAIAYVTENYRDFGPTFACQMLLERHGLRVSRETLRTWMREEGLWLSRKQRRQLHQPRLRRDHFGELVQIDGSEHRWFEDRGPRCTLIVFIDDATSRLVALRFVPSESAFAYFETLKSYLTRHGRPLAFYSDKHSIFRVSKAQAQGGQGLTQFGRALSELGIEILCANSSQAKGRVERVNRTLQDRLVKELRLEGISTLEAANAYLPAFVARFNERFAIAPARSEDLHRPLACAPVHLDTILAWREQRYVTQQLALSYDRKRIILDETPLSMGQVSPQPHLQSAGQSTRDLWPWPATMLPPRGSVLAALLVQSEPVKTQRGANQIAVVETNLVPLPDCTSDKRATTDRLFQDTEADRNNLTLILRKLEHFLTKDAVRTIHRGNQFINVYLHGCALTSAT